ncbi:uncharacterized protein LOC116248171 isoform X2 [Nymphaea colorata]|uniref:uncharacterized protein LOC116248171 isoform X2 n=1 Tax=Nymphaea colorata TaxID=210225 RepID=UPI00129EC917|nr:uncharacterized protein LOC116248171 isoform X2 [Nymphaea colorata]
MALRTSCFAENPALISHGFSTCRVVDSTPSLRPSTLSLSLGNPRPSSCRRRIRRITPAVSTNVDADLPVQHADVKATSSGWREFARRVSGEWDGYGADFSHEGKPIELPEAVVPEAFKEWEVKVFDWQTQCPTLAETEKPVLVYKVIKLLPTVGCEADAATRHSIDERWVGGTNNSVSSFAYHHNGCYVAVWPINDKRSANTSKLLELEHCLVDPGNQESRVRIVLVVQMIENGGKGSSMVKLRNVRVFREQWYGPFRNGDQLGGCSIREPAFASTEVLQNEELIGTWESHEFASRFGNNHENVKELLDETSRRLVRDEHGLVLLPKKLWCVYKESEDGKIYGEAGWLLDHDRALTSRCVLLRDGTVEAMAIGHEKRQH